MQNPRRLRLAVLAAAVVILFAQGVATALLVARSRDTAIATASDTITRVARAVEASINRSFVQVDAMLAGLPAVLGPFAASSGGRLDITLTNRLLRELNSQSFTYRDVLLVGSDGLPLATALAVSRRRPLPLSVQSGFAEVATRGGAVAIGGPVQNPATGEWTLFFARHLTIPGLGPVTGVAEVPVPLVQTLLGVGGDAPGLRVTLEREDGTLLASLPHNETRIGQRLEPPASSLLARSEGGAAAGAVVEIAGRTTGARVLAAARPTLYPALSVATTMEVDAALAGWHRERERALIASSALALLVVALALALSVVLGQRERVEAERARFRRTLESALESMSDGFVMFDAEDRLVVCNSRYRDFYRISGPFIVTGAKFEDILREGALRGQYPQAGEDIDLFVAQSREWHRGDHPPMERLLPDGRWVLITERRTPDGGTVGIRTDITALKRTMDELAAARDAAAAAGEAKSQFLARMSHELRTPLNGVLGFAQVLLADPRLAPDQREQVRTLHEAGRHLLELVNGLLDLSKIEAGRLDLHLREVALRPLLEGCAALLGPEVERKSLRFTLDIAEDLPAMAEADPTRLRQLMLNLLSNAVKFTPMGGEVTLRARRLPVLARDGGPVIPAAGLRFEVRDSGPGVPIDKRHMLFEDFVQLGSGSAPPETAGTGLGLAISARLVGLMGGRIGCESEPGEGAMFWVELPLREVRQPRGLARAEPPGPDGPPWTGVPPRFDAPLPTPAAAAPAEPAALPERRGDRRTVLVVDDVAANRLVARALLEAAGHRVELASDGIEAVAAVEHGTYDAVLMDVQMPTMDGLEATRRIRALPGPRGQVPIIALTASALPDQVEACRAAGMDGHLAKPIDRGALTAALGLLRRPGRSGGAPPAADDAVEAAPLVEDAAFAALAADLGPSARSIIGEFVDEIRRALALAAEPPGETEHGLDRLRQGVHRVLGAGRTLGARRLVALAERLQRAIGRGEAAEIRALQADLATAGAATLSALDARPELRREADRLAAGIAVPQRA